MPKPHFPKLKWEIDPTVKCPCGSGLQFRKCCRGNENLIGKAENFFGKADYESAEKSWRAELTRYIGWVFQHTLLLLKHPAGPPLELMKIDVGALEGFAERIAWVLEKRGKRESILHTFDHLARTIPLPGLNERMAYLKCLWLLNCFNDPRHANRIIEEWPSHKKIQDFLLLQIWFQMRADSLSPIKRIEVVDSIVDRADSSDEKLDYSTTKTMLTVLIGESEEARRIHTEALNAYLASAADSAKNGDFYASSVCARALEMQGILNNDKIAFERALSFLEKVSSSDLTASGVGTLHYEMGRLNLLRGNPLRAVECFTESHDRDPRALTLIYRLDAYVRLNELEKAKRDLLKLRNSSFSEDYRLEFLRSAASLAVKLGDADGARDLVKELKTLELDILNFQAQRDQLCVALLEFVDQQQQKKTTAAKRQSILDRIREASEYLHLKPNVFGLGLNLNKLFERKETDSK